MQVQFLSKFSKDLDTISIKSVKTSLIKLIAQIELAEDLKSIPHTKKLVGHKTAYRIRIGDYRIGVFYEKNVLTFARIVHRKDIYNVFP